jgi:3-oxoacyl-[acyl-carrier protein] reductase
MSRTAIPVMKSQQSDRIVNQASIAAYLAAAMLIHYDVSKAAVIPLTKVLARELGEFNITVNCIVPGMVTTEATMETLESAPGMSEMIIGSASIKRLAEPSDLIGVLEFLCSPESSYMTGQALVVDGGICMVG